MTIATDRDNSKATTDGVPDKLLKQIREFISESEWIFATSYAKSAPHEYTLKRDADDPYAFERFVIAIRAHGYDEMFWSKKMTRLNVDGLKYWTMGAPLDKTILINRAKINDGISRPIV